MAIDQTSGNGHTEFAKELGLKEAVSIAVGAMIGGGIFSILGRLAGIAGPSAVLSFLLGGIIVFLTANAYYRLVAKYPSAGGEFVILRKGFDNPIYGNIIGMMLWLGYSITIALYAFTFGLYTSEAVFEFTNKGFFNPNIEDYSGLVIFGFNTLLTGRRLFAFLAILIFMLINLKGVKETGSIQNVIVAFKVAVLMFIGAAGLYLFNPDRYRPFLTKTDPLAIVDGEVGFFGGMGGLIIGSAVIFVSYEGFQVIANTVEELKNPARDVKIGMYISVIVVTITYMLVTVATFSLIDYENTSLAGNELDIDEAALIDAVRFIGPWAVILVTLGAAASTTSAINATLLGSSRLAYVMSDYRAFPENLATLSKKSRVPYKAIIFTSLISWLFTFFGRAEAIAEVGSIIFLGIFLAINIAVIKIYPQNNNRIAKVAVVLITIYMALVFIFFFTHFDESKLALNVLLIFTIISFLTHFYYNNKEDVKEADLSKYDLQPLGTELIPEFPDDSIAVDDFFIDLENMLVPISGGQFETKNWQISAVIARKYNVNVTLLYVGTHPEKLEKPKQIFDEFGVVYEVVHRQGIVADEIIKVFNEGSYQLVNLASRRKKGFIERLFDTSVSKKVVDNVSSAVLQVHPPKYGQRRRDIEHLFMLFDGSERDEYLVRWAKIVSATGSYTTARAYHFVQVPQTISPEDAAQFPAVKRSADNYRKYARTLIDQLNLDAEPRLLYGHNFVKSLVEATRNHEPDAVLIGHTKDTGLWNRIRTRLAYRIMRNVDSAVIVYHSADI